MIPSDKMNSWLDKSLPNSKKLVMPTKIKYDFLGGFFLAVCLSKKINTYFSTSEYPTAPSNQLADKLLVQ
ncbi:hypothetical protein PYS58_09410 [Chryseobacterium indologenes]|uniref:hypothetical protein n=1 Tax=Chryseobacterium TaxID=59732 RepID=UPI0016247247|nr:MULTISPECIES: hypothetical protein [Chryseobacterium]MDM1555643.1 hypothetical protein [Chryseobacterium indologenes]WET51344.1 hypothetical protein PYS58_09410 [Chryseobacterium indologenes]